MAAWLKMPQTSRSPLKVGIFMRDLRLAVRQLIKAPAFTLVAVLTLALGIGANTAIFSVLNALLFRSLPFRDAERLIWITNTGDGGLSGVTSRVANYQDWQRLNHSFEELAAYFAFFDYGSYALLGSGEPERIRGVGVSQNFLPVLGINPMLGRNFTKEEARWNGPKVTLLSYNFWRSHFAGDAGIVGKTIVLNNASTEVVGVLPKTFDFGSIFSPGSKLEMLVPFPIAPETDQWGNTLSVIGRLKSGVTIQRAQADMSVVSKQIQGSHPERGTTWGAHLTGLQEQISGRFRSALWVLFGSVACVLLIACANLSNLLLVRSSVRRKETAVRVALGASRWQLVRQTLMESMVLSAAGAIAGLPLALGLTQLFANSTAFSIPLLGSVHLDGPALLFMGGAALITGAVFGLVPALQLSCTNVQDSLQDATRGSSGGRSNSLFRKVLVVSEIGMACVLLIAAGLLIRSFQRLLEVDPGFRPEKAIAWRIENSRSFPDLAEKVLYYDQMRRRVEALPGVESVGCTDTLPLGRNRSWGLAAKGKVYSEAEYPNAFPRMVDDGYLKTMGIPLHKGRGFTAQDSGGSEKVLIINEVAAKLIWPNEDPIGKIAAGWGGQDWKVVGVVGNVRHGALDEQSGPEVYYPMTQCPDFTAVELVVRTRQPVEALVPAVRSLLREIDPTLPLTDYKSLEQLVDQAVSPRRFVVLLLGGFSFLALLLASLGIYGVLSYSVTQRTQEIGIRMAIGAQRSTVLKLIIADGVKLALAGVGSGLVAAFLLTRLMRSLLFGVGTTDPVTFAVNALLLFGVALLACYLPAWRATRIHPMVALRQE
jgi:putative ABC transport system permease protein